MKSRAISSGIGTSVVRRPCTPVAWSAVNQCPSMPLMRRSVAVQSCRHQGKRNLDIKAGGDSTPRADSRRQMGPGSSVTSSPVPAHMSSDCRSSNRLGNPSRLQTSGDQRLEGMHRPLTKELGPDRFSNSLTIAQYQVGIQMAFRFRKSVKVAPGVRLNVSKSGLSTSVGTKGASMNLSSKGTRVSASVPGTGMSWTKRTRTTGASQRKPAKRIARERSRRDAQAEALDESTGLSWLWALLFGPIYFAVHRFWWRALLVLALDFILIGFVVAPFMAYPAWRSRARKSAGP